MKHFRILVLMHPDCVPPDSSDGYSAREINEWKTEYDVVSTLRTAGHEVRRLGVQEEIKPVRDAIDKFYVARPAITPPVRWHRVASASEF